MKEHTRVELDLVVDLLKGRASSFEVVLHRQIDGESRRSFPMWSKREKKAFPDVDDLTQRIMHVMTVKADNAQPVDATTLPFASSAPQRTHRESKRSTRSGGKNK